MIVSTESATGHAAGRIRRVAVGALFVVALLATGCGAPQAAAASQADVPAATTSAAPAALAALAMVDTPQKVSPRAYMTDFVDAGAAHQLIDVRTPEEYATGHIAGAVNMPVEEIGARLGEINQAEPVVVYCRSGNRSNQAAQILQGAGYKGVYDLGGITAWQSAGFPLE